MSDIYQSLKNTILNKDYELRDILYKINLMYIEGEITETQKQELDNLAREYANINNSIDVLQKIKELDLRVQKLEDKEETDPPIEEYPEYIPGKWYYKDDKISYKNKKYICIAPEGQVCTWNPEEYPTYWKEVVEEK